MKMCSIIAVIRKDDSTLEVALLRLQDNGFRWTLPAQQQTGDTQSYDLAGDLCGEKFWSRPKRSKRESQYWTYICQVEPTWFTRKIFKYS